MIDYKYFEAQKFERNRQLEQSLALYQHSGMSQRAKLSDMLLAMSNRVRDLEEKWENRPRLVIRLESRTVA